MMQHSNVCLAFSTLPDDDGYSYMKAVPVAMVTFFVPFTKVELSDFLTKNFPGQVYTGETTLTGIVTCVCL